MKTLFAVALAAAAVMALPMRYETKKTIDSRPVACGDGATLDSALYVVVGADVTPVEPERVGIDGLHKTRYVNESHSAVVRMHDSTAITSRAYYFRYKNLRKSLALADPGKYAHGLDYSATFDGQPEPLSRQS